MHKNKQIPAPTSTETLPAPTSTETLPASEAVRALTAQVMRTIGVEVNALSEMALRDAKLDPNDGWRYDPQHGVYVKQ